MENNFFDYLSDNIQSFETSNEFMSYVVTQANNTVRTEETITLEMLHDRVLHLEELLEDLITKGGSDNIKKEIRKRDLEDYCMPLWNQSPSPTKNELTLISQRLEKIYKLLDRKKIMSALRKWFRKKREETSSRIFNKVISDIEKKTISQLENESTNNFINRMCSNIEYVDHISKFCQVEIINEFKLQSFVKLKIKAAILKNAELNKLK